MNYTFGLPNGVKEMDIDRDSIFLGAKVVQIKVSGFEVSRDYHDSCMMDVRFDDKPLPYTSLEDKLYEDIAIKMDSVNVQDGCQSIDYCKGIFCPLGQKCMDQWRLGECQCPAGQQLNGSRCEDLNDCQQCSREGTKFCEKYEDNRIIAYENFNEYYNYEQTPAASGEYPPNFWYLNSDFTNELREARKLWKLTPSSDDAHISGHKCVCRKGYYGPFCSAQAIRRSVIAISSEAIIIIVTSLILLLILMIAFVVYSKSKRPTPKHYMLGVDPNDEVRETIINYVEEGCPDVDQVKHRETTTLLLNLYLFNQLIPLILLQSAYDITQLAKPLDPTGTLSSHHPYNTSQPNYSDGSTAIDGEFQPAIPKQKPPLQDISLIRRGNQASKPARLLLPASNPSFCFFSSFQTFLQSSN